MNIKVVVAICLITGMLMGSLITVGSLVVIIRDPQIILHVPQLYNTQCKFINTILQDVVFNSAFNRTITKDGYGYVEATISYPVGQVVIQSHIDDNGIVTMKVRVNC